MKKALPCLVALFLIAMALAPFVARATGTDPPAVARAGCPCIDCDCGPGCVCGEAPGDCVIGSRRPMPWELCQGQVIDHLPPHDDRTGGILQWHPDVLAAAKKVGVAAEKLSVLADGGASRAYEAGFWSGLVVGCLVGAVAAFLLPILLARNRPAPVA